MATAVPVEVMVSCCVCAAPPCDALNVRLSGFAFRIVVVPVPLIVMLNEAVPLCPQVFEMPSVKLNVPPVVGVPLMPYPAPFDCTLKPGGSDPDCSTTTGPGENGDPHGTGV